MSRLSLPGGSGRSWEQDVAMPSCCLRVGRAETEVGVCHPTIHFSCGPRGLTGLKSVPKKRLT